jgi:methionine sulfoxide reductase heme-binding subunit
MRSARTKYLLWSFLALPAAVALVRYWLDSEAWPGDMLHPTGEWSARFIILALCVTPLTQLFPANGLVRFMRVHRRAFGVAAFAYSLLHLLFYVLDMETVEAMLAELGAPAIWSGWLAFALLLPLGLTSNDAAMRRLKAGWKRLQRLAYPAALLTLAHWALVHDGLGAALVHFAPLALLQGWRVARVISNSPRRSIA